ncbi:DUF2203 domain-containing protein [Schlesneria paludicola]|uniref:DUF2203 domain-containing protein n=1 Tax=Schlesneria paludicola TaxID=360056 RepID=UPI00029A5E0E|nr:DUF2203 domain-containing protein [Schlesneria paludicola]
MSAKLAPRHYFSVASANQTLPLVRAIVSDIVELYPEVKDREERLTRITRGRSKDARPGDPYSEEVEQIKQELERDVERLQGFIDELQQLGVDFKDPVMGLVDFPAQRDGEEVCLCWKLGEPSVGFWHTLESGFQGRKELTEDDSEGSAASQKE